MVFLTYVYTTGRMDIEMSETPFYLKMSFRGEDASRWGSHKYTIMDAVGWKVSDSFGQTATPIREKISKIRDSIATAPVLRFDPSSNALVADITTNISIPLTLVVKQSQLPDIAEESEESWSDSSFLIEPPGYVIAECNDVHTRCQDDITEIAALMRRLSALEAENELLRGLIFRR